MKSVLQAPVAAVLDSMPADILNDEPRIFKKEDFVTSLINNLELQPKQRVLELNFGNEPLITNFFEKENIFYFGLETSENLVVNASEKFALPIKKRKALFDYVEEIEEIPYVSNFFHRIVSLQPTVSLFTFPTFLKNAYKKLVENGTMVLQFAKTTYDDTLQVMETVQNSNFAISDVQFISVETNGEFEDSIVYTLKKPIKIVKKEPKVIIIPKSIFSY